ncbi:hypothetical protein EMIHUDRAFT_208184 [Emiliania huxleyi CCMP1516]|uniref:AB hydrolase-1 domain-containing protein n=2 Tax=Emiliania huxleyi TaxID=2903 RepID=A0A0D3JC20_EMIH1|nr:hypothetical protein EMIHUDRAFT_208184 [Emiliania huxleyi CCMP1516]EOD21055.1 hypothetical protein EMIHUDRAFT_208184 [Emiliania huxleyi CCMP1516]|eukprot:XP_005773484.1 hypothetical protein EMIHUDRAFT_208184 [Emiliania huxleyi CCMP1516]
MSCHVGAATPTCDEITPDLCELRQTNDSLVVKGLRLNYWRFEASPPSGLANERLPIVMVHGGPGWSHDYLLPLKQQACRGRTVYFYDQVGAGVSERPASAKASAPHLFDIDYYPEELAALIRHLGLRRFHVLGSSWGTIVAQLFALGPNSGGLAGLVLSGPLSDATLYIRSQWDPTEGIVGAMLPAFAQRRLRALDAARDFGSAEYRALAKAMRARFTVRTYPPPDCYTRASGLMNDEIYVGIQGASEFTIGGVLAGWNITARLPALGALPTLLTAGRFDTMRPPLLRAMAAAIPNSRTLVLPHSGHCSMIDDPKLMNDGGRCKGVGYTVPTGSQAIPFCCTVQGFKRPPLSSGASVLQSAVAGGRREPLALPPLLAWGGLLLWVGVWLGRRYERRRSGRAARDIL